MPLDWDILRGLPKEVVNELAILEDRALRAESMLEHYTARTHDLQQEVGLLRTALTSLEDVAKDLLGRATELAERAQEDQEHIEQALRDVIVQQAGAS